MEFFRKFFWLSGRAGECANDYWPITLVLVCAATTALVIQHRALREAELRRFGVILSALVTPLVTLAFGAAFMHDYPTVLAPAWRSYVVYNLVLGAFSQIVIATICARGFRWLAFCTTLFACWYSLCTGFVALRAVSGN